VGDCQWREFVWADSGGRSGHPIIRNGCNGIDEKMDEKRTSAEEQGKGGQSCIAWLLYVYIYMWDEMNGMDFSWSIHKAMIFTVSLFLNT